MEGLEPGDRSRLHPHANTSWEVTVSLQRFLSVVLLVSLVPRSAQAQDPASSDTTKLQDLVVTATRYAIPRREAPATVTSVSGEELRGRGFRFVADWLREVPGVAVVASGSIGGVTSLFLRGGESDYTKVLVDGVAANLPGGAIDLANLSLENVERIEVLRGPASVLYGSDAVTGVIQIFTRRGRGTGQLNTTLMTGSHGISDLRVGYSGKAGIMDWSAHLARFGSSGSYPFNSQYRSLTGSGRLGFRPDVLTDLALSFRTGDGESHFPTDFAGVLADSNQYTTERSLLIGLDAGRQLGHTVSVRVAGSLFRSRRGFLDASDGAADTTGFGFAGTRDGVARRGVVDARLRWDVAPRLSLTGGAEWSTESADETSVTSSNFGGGVFAEQGQFDASRRNAGYYGQAQFEATRGLDLHGGFRLEDNSVFGGFSTWRFGAVLLPNSVWRLHAAAGTAFRQPTFAEQYADTPFEVGNPDLEPERGGTWEVGVESRLADGALEISATWFDQQFRDMIQYQFTNPGDPTYQNLARAEARGLELGGHWQVTGSLSVSVGYTRLLTEVVEAGSPGPAFDPGRTLLRRPPHSGTAGAHWVSRSGARVDADLVLVGRRDDVDYGTFPAARVPLEGYQLINLSADLPLRPPGSGLIPGNLTVTARVDNLFNQHYLTVIGFPGRGRVLLAGFRVGR
jgi:vitamin B12 transporter